MRHPGREAPEQLIAPPGVLDRVNIVRLMLHATLFLNIFIWLRVSDTIQ